MAVTRLERKGRKNKNVAKNRVNTIKRLNAFPAIKKVDIEAIKEEFAGKSKVEKEATKAPKAKAPKTEAKKKEAVKADSEVKEVASDVKAEAAKADKAPKAKKKETTEDSKPSEKEGE